MEGIKISAYKPMILATCVAAGVGIGLLGHLLLGNSQAGDGQSCATLDVAALNKMVADHASGINSGQAITTVDQYNNDIVTINSMDEDWVMNRDSALVSMNDFLKGKPTAKYTPKTQFIGCNVAWSIGYRDTDWTDQATKAKIHRHARYTMIFRHGEKGWKISHIHFSVPAPLTATATATPAAEAKGAARK